jgi:hypothetical protein
MKLERFFTKSGNGPLGAPDDVPLLRILLSGKLKSARQGRIVGADRKRAAADYFPKLMAQHRTRKKEIGKWNPSRHNRIFRIPSSTRHERNGTISRSIWSVE